MITSGAKATQLLGIKFIPVEVTLKDSADYLIKNGFLKK
jgi:dihydroflavonol-4-reductase